MERRGEERRREKRGGGEKRRQGKRGEGRGRGLHKQALLLAVVPWCTGKACGLITGNAEMKDGPWIRTEYY